MRSDNEALWRVIYIARGEQQARDIGDMLSNAGFLIDHKPLEGSGARTEDIPALAAKTKKTNPANGTTGGAFPMHEEDIEAILRIADR